MRESGHRGRSNGLVDLEGPVAALVERTGVAALPRSGRFSAMVVAQQPGLREAVTRTLRALGAREVAQAATVAQARQRAVATLGREICVTEVGLPDGSGIGLAAELRSMGWQRGLVLSAVEDGYTVRAALTAGVRCFLVAGRPGQVTSLPTGRNATDSLSAREIEVLQLVADGRSNKEIGTQLGLSALTVKSHLARIARKLGTGDRAEMVAIALRTGTIR